MLSTQSLHLVEDRHRTLQATAAAHRAATHRADPVADRRPPVLERVRAMWVAVRVGRQGRPAPARPVAARATSS